MMSLIRTDNLKTHQGGIYIMKFKSSEAINQRIERITAEHLVVGIDIAKEKHVARAVNYRGLERGKHLTFNNDRWGFEKLQYTGYKNCNESMDIP